MAEPVALVRGGRRTLLKWHRARRRASDPVFTGRRILEGMAIGASVEVDLVVHGDDGFAVLHDLALGRESTGGGPVRATPADGLRQLRLRDNDGRPIPDRVMLIEDLAALIAREGAHPEALLQLDYKEDAAALTPRAVATFGRALRPVARHCILSSGDAEAVRLLAADVAGLRIGYDPCHQGATERLAARRDYPAFVADALAASPDAELIYLDHALVLAAAADGCDLVAAFHAAGRRVDAYTIRRADAEGIAAARRLLALSVDQITTDDPEGLGAALAQDLPPR
jgi:glycerophosphoryl diester phosphodiesterase